jgi:hypothetical protein
MDELEATDYLSPNAQRGFGQTPSQQLGFGAQTPQSSGPPSHDGTTSPSQFSALQATISTLNAQNVDLQNRLREAERQRTERTTTPPPAVQRRARINDPATYDDSDRSLFPAFLIGLHAKFAVDGDIIGGPEARMWYAYNRLSGNAAKRALPWLQSVLENESSRNQRTIDAFADQLRKLFDDPQRQQKALTRLNNDKQKGMPMPDFLVRFEENLNAAGGIQWSDVVKIGFLEAALNSEMLSAIVGTTMSTSYDNYCDQLRSIYTQTQRAKHAASARQAPKPQQTPADPNAMDWEKTAAFSTPSTRRGRGPKPAKGGRTAGQDTNGRQKRQAKWVNEATLAARKEAGACLRCGSQNHFIRDCKMLAATNPNRRTAVGAVQPKRADLQEEEYEDEEESDEDQGKEIPLR